MTATFTTSAKLTRSRSSYSGGRGDRVTTGVAPAVATSSPTAIARCCLWCHASLSDRQRFYCSKRCGQSVWRLRHRRDYVSVGSGRPPGLTFAYADPPYPRKAFLYKGEPDFGGEVDHAELIASLLDERYDGWALSTSAASLRDLLPLCPPAARVCAWVKPIGVSSATYGLHSTWEALIVVGGRKRRPGIRDWLRAQSARGNGTLLGRKPIAFCAWLFDCLGMIPGDNLVDLFPGTGIVARSWQALSRQVDQPRGPEKNREAGL